MKAYNQPQIEMILNDAREDIITTSDQQDFLRLIGVGSGNTWDVASAPRE